jgi:hypothetical protein
MRRHVIPYLAFSGSITSQSVLQMDRLEI